MKRFLKVAVVAFMVVSLVAQGNVISQAKGKGPKISQKNLVLNIGDSKKLSVKNGKGVKWSSGNNSVATIGKMGKVTAKAAGTATITAKVNGKKLTCKVTVKVPKIKKIELEDDEIDLEPGETFQLEAAATPKKAIAGVKLTWSSDDEEVVTVDQNGKIKAMSEGFATITVKAGNKKAICEVEVCGPDEDEDDWDDEDSEDEDWEDEEE